MSQVNHNYSYVFEIDGHTPWERLRVVRNFMSDRRKALALTELAQTSAKNKRGYQLTDVIDRHEEIALMQVIHNDDFGVTPTDSNGKLEAIRSIRKIRKLEADLQELHDEIERTEIELQDHVALTQDCRDEVAFLEVFESKLVKVCEKTRVAGKSDREMYEINFPEEARTRLFLRCVNEQLSHGTLTSDTLHYLRRDPEVVTRLLERKILTRSAAEALGAGVSSDSLKIQQLVKPIPVTSLEDKSSNK